MRRLRPYAAALAAAAWGTVAAAAAAGDHPFILWTREEAAALRRKVQTQAWAQAALEQMRRSSAGGDVGTMGRLFRYSVMGERDVGEQEKQALLGAAKAGRRSGGTHLDALRYDTLYDLLTPEERRDVEQAWRRGIADAIKRQTGHGCDRVNWLPNYGYPWYIGWHIAAVAMRDKDLVRKIFHSDFGLGWYIGQYLADMGFYCEEFAKGSWSPPLVLLYARGCERLGIGDVGYGFRPKGGATVRGHLESWLAIGYPRVDLDTGRDHYPTLTMGDAKNQCRHLPGYPFQQANVCGYLAGGTGRRDRQYGGFLSTPYWFEMGHAAWPDAGFDYFLAQMRPPGQDKYYPSLFFGLDPIDPAKVKPPAARSAVHDERGIAMLRAEEGPAYWESPAPAVGVRLAAPYVHESRDSFSLMGLYAFNRPIYVNRKIATNYSNVDPGWSHSMRSHSGVIVDFREPAMPGEVPSRSHFTPQAKFMIARGGGIWPDVTQARALVLTGQYLLDAFALDSPRPRHYLWTIQTLGHACPDEPHHWAASRDLLGWIYDLANEQSRTTDGPWSVTAVQYTAGAHPDFSGLGRRWFERRIGARVTMLGGPGTTAYTAWAPVLPDSPGRYRGRERFMYGAEEPAGVTIAAARRARATAFVALHEPFSGHWRLERFERIAQTPEAVGVRIAGAGVDDRICVRLDGKDERAVLAGGGEAFAFRSYAFVRSAGERVDVAGDLQGMRLAVGDRPRKLFVNDKPAQAGRDGAYLVYGSVPEAVVRDAAPWQPLRPTIAARWRPETALRIAAGGSATAVLKLRNNGAADVRDARIRVVGADGLTITPAVVEIPVFRRGSEMQFDVTVRAAPRAPNRLMLLRLAPAGPSRFDVEPAPLKVACGVVQERTQFWPADFARTIYAPRYLARYYYMESAAAGMLLDPDGIRRVGSEGHSFPSLLIAGQDDRGRAGWERRSVPGFPYWDPVTVRGAAGKAAIIYARAWHPHLKGLYSPLEHWFMEDWIVVRYRYAKPGDRIVIDWLGGLSGGLRNIHPGVREDIAREKMPGKVLLVGPDGKLSDLGETGQARGGAAPRQAAALFVRPPGLRHGAAMFYPKDSHLDGRGVVQPAEQPMAFTYCTEGELPGLAAKWLKAACAGEAEPALLKDYGYAEAHLFRSRQSSLGHQRRTE